MSEGTERKRGGEDGKRRSLGRGLSALFAEEAGDQPEMRKTIRNLPIEQIQPGRYQPRRQFDPASLDELAASIRDKGILQPLLVRVHATLPNMFELIAGERRWRAAQLVPLHEVPVIVRDFSDRDTLEIALIENLQRADLNAIDEASAYMRLMEEFRHTQEDLARVVGKSRSHVANTLRLLGLPEPVHRLIAEGRLTAGQARPLIGHARAAALAREVVERGLSARQVEAMVQRQKAAIGDRDPASPRPARAVSQAVPDPNLAALARELETALGQRVTLAPGAGGAVDVTLHCADLDQLDAVLARLRA